MRHGTLACVTVHVNFCANSAIAVECDDHPNLRHNEHRCLWLALYEVGVFVPHLDPTEPPHHMVTMCAMLCEPDALRVRIIHMRMFLCVGRLTVMNLGGPMVLPGGVGSKRPAARGEGVNEVDG
jgi:hypothetical protein